MFESFGLFKSVGKFFEDSFEFVSDLGKLASPFLDKVKDDSRGFAPRRIDLDSRIRGSAPRLQEMQAPVGLRSPNIQAAARYFAEKQAKDANLRILQERNFRPGRTSKLASIKPTVKLEDATIKLSPKPMSLTTTTKVG